MLVPNYCQVNLLCAPQIPAQHDSSWSRSELWQDRTVSIPRTLRRSLELWTRPAAEQSKACPQDELGSYSSAVLPESLLFSLIVKCRSKSLCISRLQVCSFLHLQVAGLLRVPNYGDLLIFLLSLVFHRWWPTEHSSLLTEAAVSLNSCYKWISNITIYFGLIPSGMVI